MIALVYRQILTARLIAQQNESGWTGAAAVGTVRPMRLIMLFSLMLSGAAVRADVLGDVLRLEGYVAVTMTPLPTGHRTVTVMLNGQIGAFIVDSGASQTVVDTDAARLYPLRASLLGSNVVGAIGPLRAEVREVSGYGLGPVTGGALTVVVADIAAVLAAVEDAGGGVVDGVLGQDILDRHEAIIDLPGERLFLRP